MAKDYLLKKSSAPVYTEPLLAQPDSLRDNIRHKAIEGLEDFFPIIGARHTIEVEDLQVDAKEFGNQQHKKALMEGRSLQESIKGRLVIKDNQTGKVVDKSRPGTLINLPWVTHRGTFLVDGTEYNISNQVRLKPGIYTRKKGNDELETQFNTQSTAPNFKVTMKEDTGLFYLQVGSVNIGLYPLLRGLDVPHGDIARAWGGALADVNESKFRGKEAQSMDSLYKKLVFTPNPNLTLNEKKDIINKTFEDSKLNPEVTLRTLGHSFNHVTTQSILEGSKKLLAAYKDNKEVDDRDNLAFKTVHRVDDIIKEQVSVGNRSLKFKLQQRLDRAYEPTVKDIMPASPFTPSLKNFLSSTQLRGLPDQYNLLDSIDSSLKVTAMGEGGIGSDRAITMEARTVHPSHLGIIDPISTPESGKIGVDLRMAQTSLKDNQGNMYTQLRNFRTGKLEKVDAMTISNSVVAFFGQDDKLKSKRGTRRNIEALDKGQVTTVAAKDVDYVIHNPAIMFGPMTSMIPFTESIQGNRSLMVAKHLSQTLPLKRPELPMIQVQGPGSQSMEDYYGRSISVVAPVAGTITKVDSDYVYLRPDKSSKTAARDADLIKIPYSNYLPSGSKSGKTFMHHTPRIKIGDHVSQGQLIADARETVNGTLALGTNLKTAYLPYKGYNSNDAVVISERAAEKLTSAHMYKKFLEIESTMKVGVQGHRSHFGSNYTAENYSHLDHEGIAKPKSRIKPGDILIAAIDKTAPSVEALALGKLHKSLVKPYRDCSVVWDKDYPGLVESVFKTPRRISITVITEEKMKVGDKLTNRYGGKGVVGAVIPTDQMVRDASGEPIDLLYPSASVISRVNPAQVLETALAKVAEKEKTPYKIPLLSGRNNVEWVTDELKKHGISDKETVYDPVEDKHIPNIMVGPQYVLKLAKTTETNYSARGIEDYDINEQPSSGGDSGSKAFGRMEFTGLLAHNARNILKDSSTTKSQRNDEYWRRVRLNLPTIAPKENFAHTKFNSMLTASGIKVNKQDNIVSLSPLIDNDILKMSSGEIKDAKFIRSKDLMPEKGGFFDEATTGGNSGTKWSHIHLEEPVINPVFEDAARRLLGYSGPQFKESYKKDGGQKIKQKLNAINLPQKRKELEDSLDSLSGSALQNAVKQIKAIDALQKHNLKAGDAYVIQNVPVLPPVMRPIVPNKKGDLLMSDANYLLRDVFLANDAVKDSKILPENMREQYREHLSDSVGALFGMREPASPQSQTRGVKGYITGIAGSSPKHGFFQNKLIRRQQDLSGRSTVAPDMSLGIEELGVPEDMMWTMYEPFIMKRLSRKGFGALESKKMIDDKHPTARQEMLDEAKERPVLWNRAPSLHRFSIVASYPKAIPGKTITVPSPWPEPGMNLDYDGDAVQLHVPVSAGAVEEAKKMTLPNLLTSDKSEGDLLIRPQHESVLGLYTATSAPASKGPAIEFPNWDAAWNAYRKGDVTINTPVVIKD